MHLLLDTADPAATRRFLGTGLFRGVTCNPAILLAAGLGADAPRKYYDTAKEAGAERVFIQTVGADFDAQVDLAQRYRAFGDDVVIKVVATATGLAVASALERQGVTCLLTAVHDSKQTIGAMASGATYVTPYLSEMYAAGRDGIAQVLSMMAILRAVPSRTSLIMAGLNDMSTFVTLAEAGMDKVTITPAFADKLFAQPETEAMAAFFDRASDL